jgi:hypothetical protein
MKPVIVSRHKDGQTHFAEKVSAKAGIVDKWTEDGARAAHVHPDDAEKIGERHARTPGGGRLRFRDPVTGREELAAVESPERAEKSVVATMAEAAAKAAAGPDAAFKAQVEALTNQLDDLRKKYSAECLSHEQTKSELAAAEALLRESAPKPPASPPAPPVQQPAAKS